MVFFSPLRFLLILGLVVTLNACSPKVRFIPGEIPQPTAPTAQEQAQGAQVIVATLQSDPVSNDPRYVQRVERVVGRLLAVTPSSSHWRVFIVKKNVWNAFTVPGNYIVVFTQLLDDLKSDDELAAVLGHEIGHRLAQHDRAFPEKMLGAALAQVVGAAVGKKLQKEGATQNDVMLGATLSSELVKGFTYNKFSQTQEREADQIGLFLMADAGFNPAAAVAVWHTQFIANPEQEKFTFFSSHPGSGDREQFLRAQLPAAQMRLAQSANHRTAIQSSNSPQRYTYSPTTEALNFFNQGKVALNASQETQATQYFSAAVQRDPKFLEAKTFLGIAQTKSRDLSAAKRTFSDAIKIAPNIGVTYYNLACVHSLLGENEQALNMLKKSFALDGSLRIGAKNDSDLFSLVGNKQFEQLLNQRGRATYQVNKWP